MCLALPGKIVSITESGDVMRLGIVDFGGVSRDINLSLVPEARPGQFVLVHVGVAIHVFDELEPRQDQGS